jgi:hypothetical protein
VRRLACLCVGCVALVTSCDLFERDRRPYTPFAVASGRPLESAAPLPAPLPAPTAAPRTRSVLQAPPRATRWKIGERELEAPAGLTFKLALSGNLASGDTTDVVAWLIGPVGGPTIGELWFFPANGESRRLATPPSFIPTGPSCEHTVRLESTGKNSITFDVSATCSTPLLPRAPTRSVSVLAPLREQPVIMQLALAPPAFGERLDVDVNSDDRDGDELDDVELITVLEAAGAPAAEARFVWLDRPTGASQDTAEPAKSFGELGAKALTRAKDSTTSGDVAGHIDNARRLYASLCAEGGVPRLFNSAGTPLACGDLSAAFDSFSEAAISAALSRRDVPLAFAELERHTWYPTAANPAAFMQRWLKILKREVALRRVIKLVPLKARPQAMGNTPRFSPLSFHADGSLLLLTDEGLVRAAPDGRFEYEASEEIDPWPTVVVSPWGDRLIGVEYPCDRNEVGFLTSSAEGAPRPPQPTALTAPRPGRCASPEAFNSPAVSPLGWSKAGLSVLLGPIPVGPRTLTPVPMGSALSPNGRQSIVATRWGLLVTGESKPALWFFDDDKLSPQLSDCVVSNNSQAAACILGRVAYVALPDPASG